MMKKLFTLAILMISVSAMTITVEQTGADSGKIMKGDLFTATASSWSGTCTSANLDLSGCPVCSLQNEESVKTLGDDSSVTWTSLIASQTASSQTITISLSGCSPPESATSSSFQVILGPEIGTSISPTSFSNPTGSKQLSLTVENEGDNSLQDVYATLTLPSGVTTSDSLSQDLGNLLGGSSIGTAWILSFGSVSTSTISIDITSSNGGSETETSSITVSTTPPDENNDGPSGGPSTTTGSVTVTTPDYEASYGDNFEVTATVEGTYTFLINTTLKKITATMGENSTLSATEVVDVEDLPSNIQTYKVYDFESENEVSEIYTTFSVPIDWIVSQGASYEDVFLLKKVGKTWEKVDLDLGGRDDNYKFYKVKMSEMTQYALAVRTTEDTQIGTTTIECAEPSEWSECIESTKTRTIEEAIDGKCVKKEETKACFNSLEFFNTERLLILLGTLLLVVFSFLFFRKRWSKPISSGGISALMPK